LAELPIAILLGAISLRLLHANVRAARGQEPDAASRPLWRTPLITAAELSDSGSELHGARRSRAAA
jgi:hypothetical protein